VSVIAVEGRAFVNNSLTNHLRHDSFSTISWTFIACCTCFAIAWFSSKHVVLQAASLGFTPVGMMNPVHFLPNLANDFPNGEGEMMKSLVGWVYLAFGTLGLSERISTFVMVAAEAATMIAGSYRLARITNPHLPVWTGLAAAVLVSASAIASADFARWFHPYYGSVYNFAFGAGFAALAATLERRLVLGGLLIGISATIHPIIGLFIGVAMGIAVLSNFRAYQVSSMVFGAIAATVVFGIWYIIAFRDAAVAASSIDGELFVTLTRLMGSHWHPIGLDIFGDRAWEVLLPFCALVVVFVTALSKGAAATANTDRQIAIAASCLFLISLYGLWLSETSNTPVIVKLALHRASLVLLLIAAIVSVPRLISLSQSAPLLTAITTAGLLLLPFWRGHGLPIFGAALFGFLVILGFAGKIGKSARICVALALAMAAIVCFALIAFGHWGAIVFDVRSTLGSVATGSFIVAFALMIAARLVQSPFLTAAGIAIGVAFWAPQIDPMRNPNDRAAAMSFLSVQEWASRNTTPESVFMLDPVLSYAWRQYSQRPSFGTLREWLYAGWIYNTDPDVMNEGIRRAGLLGIDAGDFKPAPGQSISDAYGNLVAKARDAFTGMDKETLDRFAVENNISYFVFKRDTRADLSDLNVPFENERYVVVKPSG
jgi:hypothetical protein